LTARAGSDTDGNNTALKASAKTKNKAKERNAARDKQGERSEN
jgi:hypothetical protein